MTPGTAFHAAEEQTADAGGHALGAALQDGADAVARGAGVEDLALHLEGEIVSLRRTDLNGLRRDGDAAALKDLAADGAGKDHARREPAAEGAAAAQVHAAAELHCGGIVRVAGPRRLGMIVRGVLVAVFENGRQRRTGGLVVIEAGEDQRLVGFLAGRGEVSPAGGAAAHLHAHGLEIDALPRRQSVHDDADAGAVALAEDGDADELSVGIHKIAPFRD